MNNLVLISKEEVFTDSMVIAEGTGVGHRKLKITIRKYQENFDNMGKLSAPYQAESTGGRPEEIYRLNEQQATFLITLLKNTDVVVRFKEELVKQFYAMRQILLQKQSPIWQDTRALSKEIRKRETDSIKALVDYAKANGSTHAERYYTSLSRLADKAAGIYEGSRDTATIEHLNRLCMVENIIEKCILDGISQSLSYKEVYGNCKERLEQFRTIAYLAG